MVVGKNRRRLDCLVNHGLSCRGKGDARRRVDELVTARLHVCRIFLCWEGILRNVLETCVMRPAVNGGLEECDEFLQWEELLALKPTPKTSPSGLNQTCLGELVSIEGWQIDFGG